MHKSDNSRKSMRKKGSTASITRGDRVVAMNMQTALNYFGFDAGTPDGAIGPRTRAAISEYQKYRGIPETGVLSPTERTQLIHAYHLTQVEPQDATLVADRRIVLERTIASIENSRVTALSAAAPTPETLPLPNFSPEGRGLGEICIEVEAREKLSATLGTEKPLTEGEKLSFLLERRLCSSRHITTLKGAQLMASNPNLGFEQIADSCRQVPLAMNGALKTDWQTSNSEEIISTVNASDLTQSSENYGPTATICAFVGYRLDDREMVLMSSILGVVSGNMEQAETVGLLLAIQDKNWDQSEPILSWFNLAYSAPRFSKDVDREELKSSIADFDR